MEIGISLLCVVCIYIYKYNDGDDCTEYGFVVAFILSLDNTGFHHYFLTIMGNSVGMYTRNNEHNARLGDIHNPASVFFSSFFFNSFCGE